MKKILIIFAVSFLFFTGCTSAYVKRYERISNIIVGLYHSAVYDSDGLETHEKELIENHLNKLKRDVSIVNIEGLIDRSNVKRVNKPNSPEIIMKDGMCYVNFAELDFSESNQDDAGEQGIELICNGYSVYLYESDFGEPYDELIKSPLFDYRYYGYKEVENGYRFMYISNYDKTGLSVYITVTDKKVSEISVVFEKTEEISNQSGWIIVVAAIAIISIAGFFFFKMKKNVSKSAE